MTWFSYFSLAISSALGSVCVDTYNEWGTSKAERSFHPVVEVLSMRNGSHRMSRIYFVNIYSLLYNINLIATLCICIAEWLNYVTG